MNQIRITGLFLLASTAAFSQAQPAEPTTAEEYYARAQTLLAQKEYDRVIADCTQAIERQPDLTEALLMRATAYSIQRQPLKAIADLDNLLRMRPRASTFVLRANQYVVLKKYDLALADFNEAIRQMPNRAATYSLRATVRHSLGDIAGAREDVEAAMRLAQPRTSSQLMATLPEMGKSFRVGPGVTPPQVEQKQEPTYSEEARQAKVNGSVLLSFVVDEQGQARDIRIVRPLGYGLDENAVEAVQKWRFKPGMKDGRSVPVFVQVEVNFRLL